LKTRGAFGVLVTNKTQQSTSFQPRR